MSKSTSPSSNHTPNEVPQQLGLPQGAPQLNTNNNIPPPSHVTINYSDLFNNTNWCCSNTCEERY